MMFLDLELKNEFTINVYDTDMDGRPIGNIGIVKVLPTMFDIKKEERLVTPTSFFYIYNLNEKGESFINTRFNKQLEYGHVDFNLTNRIELLKEIEVAQQKILQLNNRIDEINQIL